MRKMESYDKLIEDLELAQSIQTHMLPLPLGGEQISINGVYMPIEVLGGDLYYWEQMDSNQYAVILLDVMGHGVATSMICMYLRSLLPHIMRYYTEPVSFMKQLNKKLVEFNDQLTGRLFHATALYLVVDTNKRTVSYVNAGHPYGVMMEGTNDVVYLDKGCIPLGIFEDLNPESDVLSYRQGVNLMLYSDGIFELLRQNNLDPEYIINYVKYYSMSLPDKPVPLNKLAAMIQFFPRTDDVSLIYLQLK